MERTDVKRASQAVWEAMAQEWDRRHAYIEETAWAVTERMLGRLAPNPGEAILDLAAGTGIVGFAVAAGVGRDGRVIVSDFAEAMVETARRRAGALGLDNVECRVLDAERLDLDDGVVDGVVCRWGYMLMPDPRAALAETRRVLRPGGRLSCAVFAGAHENPWAALPMGVLEERGHVPPAQAGAPGILALGDRNVLESLLAGAGFDAVEIDEVGFEWTFADADDYWGFLNDAAGAVAMLIAQLDDGERSLVRADITERLAPFHRGGAIVLPAVCLVVSAS